MKNYNEVEINDSMQHFQQILKQYPVLNNEDVIKYSIAKKNGDRKARDMLINSNLRLVVNIAKTNKSENSDLLDLIHAGIEGLIFAVDKFEVERDVQFSTYATYWIKRCIRIERSKNKHTFYIPYKKILECEKYRAQISSEQNKLGRELTHNEIEQLIGIKYEKFAELNLYEIQDEVSLEKPINDLEDSSYGDIIGDTTYNIEDKCIDKLLLDEIKDYIANSTVLTKIEVDALLLRYSGKTCQQIANELNITRQRASQIIITGNQKIRIKKKIKNNQDFR